MALFHLRNVPQRHNDFAGSIGSRGSSPGFFMLGALFCQYPKQFRGGPRDRAYSIEPVFDGLDGDAHSGRVRQGVKCR